MAFCLEALFGAAGKVGVLTLRVTPFACCGTFPGSCKFKLLIELVAASKFGEFSRFFDFIGGRLGALLEEASSSSKSSQESCKFGAEFGFFLKTF